MLRFKVMT